MKNAITPVGFAGLSEAEVSERLALDGYNELPSTGKRSIFSTAFDVIREPMLLLLVSCGAVYLILGDVQEALMLLGQEGGELQVLVDLGLPDELLGQDAGAR